MEDSWECSSECPLAYYLDYASRRCKRCQESCLRCSSEDNCQECSDGFVNIGGICYDECPSGYIETNDLGCIRDPCITSTESSEECIYCLPPFYLEENQCLE